MSQHVDDEDLERYVLGLTTAQEADAIKEHYFGCPACTRRLRASAAYIEPLIVASKRIRHAGSN